MNEVTLDEVNNEMTFFHFSPVEQKQSIEHFGLLAKIGHNAEGVEDSPKVFFSKGKMGVLEACDVWIKWMLHNGFGMKDKYGFYQGKNLEERKKRVEEWNREFLNREYLKDTKKLEKVFELVYQGLQRQVYYKLDLVEGIDFDYQDIDEVKIRALRKKEQGNENDYIYQKEMFGNFSNIESPIMDSWNMHTKPYKEIEKEKISQVVTSSGKTDGLSIIQEIYETRGKNRKWDVLDNFMSYVYRKEKIKSKLDTQNIELNTMLEDYNKSQITPKSLSDSTQQNNIK